MREIKFRGKNKEIGWVYGQLAYDINGNAYIIQEVEIDTSYGLEENILFATMWYRVDKETIGQYTELKDKNRKEIYEGDIVKAIMPKSEDEDYNFIGTVVYSNTYYAIILKNNDEWDLGYLDEIEVIGNIYDNPKLLKE